MQVIPWSRVASVACTRFPEPDQNNTHGALPHGRLSPQPNATSESYVTSLRIFSSPGPVGDSEHAAIIGSDTATMSRARRDLRIIGRLQARVIVWTGYEYSPRKPFASSPWATASRREQ